MRDIQDSAAGPSASAPIHGVVVYEVRGDGSLIGVWSYDGYEGKIGLEWALGGTPGVLEGRYDVHIYNAAGKSVYQGSLTIGKQGGTYQLAWETGGQTGYKGIGLMAGDRLAASYWSV